MSPQLYGDDSLVREFLESCETWAIVGLGTDPEKPVHRVARFLQSHGKRIIPIHPRGIDVLGEKAYVTIADAVAAESIDIADFFIAAQRVAPLMEQAVANGIMRLWLQLDVIDESAAGTCVARGARVVMDRCPAIEWPRIMGDRGL